MSNSFLSNIVNSPAYMAAAEKAKEVVPTTSEKLVHYGNISKDNDETDQQIHDRINERFEITEMLVDSVISGSSRALIVSGPPGLGKSFTIEKKLSQYSPTGDGYNITKGFSRPTGLFKTFFDHKNPGQVSAFDDLDSIFNDETSLNFLKAACDTTEERNLSYLTEALMFSDTTGEPVPKQFEFEGSVIFITNYDFDAMVQEKHKLTPHIQALLSRAHYIDLSMKSSRDYIIRIKQVMAQGLFDEGMVILPPDQQQEVIDFIEGHKKNIRELSIRMAIKIGILLRDNPANWERIAKITCLKK